MPTATIVFDHCSVMSQEYRGTDDHMISQLFFSLQVAGNMHSCHCDVKQTAGGSFEHGDLEIGPPKGYKGPFNHDQFRKHAEAYYRRCIGSQGQVLGTSPRTRNMNIEGCEFHLPMTVTIEVPTGASSW